MSADPYSSCPCGSGKKFKWCCQPIHAEIERAFEQFNSGQQEAAVRTMADVVREHSGNPEAWGRQAQLLAISGKVEEAEQALQKAFDLNPNYPFGFMLRGTFRQQEGELIGALLLFRKAAEAYAPDAHDPLSYIHELIANLEMRLNKPVAARAALKRAVHFHPANAELKQAFEATFGEKSRLPKAAVRDYELRSPAQPPPDWGAALAGATTGRLSDALRVFRQWTQTHADDAAGRYDLGLVLAWLGDNPSAVEALGRYVELEADDAKAGDAWALAEVLRCGHGMEADADYVENRVLYQIREPNAVIGLLQSWEQSRRVIGLRSDPEQGILAAIVLEEMPTLALSGAAAPPAKLAAYLLIAGNLLQFWHPNPESVGRVADEAQEKLGNALGEPRRITGPVNFGDVAADALLFPTAATTELEAELKVKEHAQQYFEDKWVHRALKALNGRTPEDAAGDKTLRKRLRGVIQFLQDCSAENTLKVYHFDRLRQRLGLTGTAAPAAASDAQKDVSAMKADDLAALDPAEMTDAALEQAYRTAHQQDARDLAAKFARALVERPPPAGTDRYPFFVYLIQDAQNARDFDRAISLVDEGMKADCEANEGRRRNDYELRRGQLLGKRGDADAARETFQRLLERTPADLKVAGSATEAMLGLKKGSLAKQFAEHGLAHARAQNNRDSEAYFLELLDAVKKQGG
jgi:tetratricopeptide (TPR) repeat protein